MKWMTGLVGWFMGLFGIVTTNTEEVTKIQAAAVKACGFLPTFETVTALMGAVVPVPGVATGTLIAKKICQAVTKKPVMLAGPSAPIVVDGVVIEGEWVQK